MDMVPKHVLQRAIDDARVQAVFTSGDKSDSDVPELVEGPVVEDIFGRMRM